MNAWPVVGVLVASGVVLWCWDRSAARKRSGRCPCRACGGWRPARRPARWLWRRLKAVLQPGHAWRSRVRHGLSWTEWAMRDQCQMAAGHPESMTGELDSADESFLAELDEQLEAW